MAKQPNEAPATVVESLTTTVLKMKKLQMTEAEIRRTLERILNNTRDVGEVE